MSSLFQIQRIIKHWIVRYKENSKRQRLLKFLSLQKKISMIFVTGGTGLIGSHLLYKLVSEGKKVRALKRTSSNTRQVFKTISYYTENPEELFNRIDWVTGDVLDYFEMENLIAGVDEVYHCAAIVSFNSADRRKLIRTNVEGTANIVNASLENRVKKFCHVSSVSALGASQNGLPADEHTNWVPSKKVNAYSESKFFSEAEVWRGIQEGLDAIIVNPSIVLGPGKWDSGSPTIFKTVWDGLQFYTKGTIGYVDVKDVVKVMFMLMTDENFKKFKNQRFLLSSENWSYQKLLNCIADFLQKSRPKWAVSGLMLGIAWKAAIIFNLVAKRRFPITRETAVAANAHKIYDGSKIINSIGFNYLPILDSVKQTAEILIKDMQNMKTY